MQTYRIQIKGMHCSGCKNLIKMSLEDEGFENINVDENSGIANFSNDLELSDQKTILDKIFADLKEYTYSNLELIKH